MSRRYLLVLDINGTLLERKSKGDKVAHAITRDFSSCDKQVFLRPHLQQFLLKVSQIMDIALWTSAMPKSANALFSTTFAPYNFVFKWTRLDCNIDGAGKKQKTTKDLSKIYSEFPMYNAKNTLILDDSLHKILALQAKLHIPTYTVSDPCFNPLIDTDLISAYKYLKVMIDSDANDVYSYTELNPFLSNDPLEKEEDKFARSKYLEVKKNEQRFAVLDKWKVNEGFIKEFYS